MNARRSSTLRSPRERTEVRPLRHLRLLLGASRTWRLREPPAYEPWKGRAPGALWGIRCNHQRYSLGISISVKFLGLGVGRGRARKLGDQVSSRRTPEPGSVSFGCTPKARTPRSRATPRGGGPTLSRSSRIFFAFSSALAGTTTYPRPHLEEVGEEMAFGLLRHARDALLAEDPLNQVGFGLVGGECHLDRFRFGVRPLENRHLRPNCR